jgi:hypothetical protein
LNAVLLDDGQEAQRRPAGALDAAFPVGDQVFADVEIAGKDRL